MTQAEILSNQTNCAVVQLPTRRFPGVVVQGDSLSGLVADLRTASEALGIGDLDEAQGWLAEVIDWLEDAKTTYETTLADRGIELPYPS